MWLGLWFTRPHQNFNKSTCWSIARAESIHGSNVHACLAGACAMITPIRSWFIHDSSMIILRSYMIILRSYLDHMISYAWYTLTMHMSLTWLRLARGLLVTCIKWQVVPGTGTSNSINSGFARAARSWVFYQKATRSSKSSSVTEPNTSSPTEHSHTLQCSRSLSRIDLYPTEAIVDTSPYKYRLGPHTMG